MKRLRPGKESASGLVAHREVLDLKDELIVRELSGGAAHSGAVCDFARIKAPHAAHGSDRGKFNRCAPALVPGHRAARTEGAARERLGKIRNHAGDALKGPALFACLGNGGKQLLRVRVERPGEKVLARRLFEDFPRIHQRHPVGHLLHHRQIVRNQDERHGLFAQQRLQQLEHLRLQRHVERRRRLVGNDDLGLRGKRHGDHDALLLSAGKFVRERSEPLPCSIDSDPLKPGLRLGERLRLRQAAVEPHRFAELIADRHHGIEPR